MAPKKKCNGGSAPRDQYFTAIKQQKLDTLRWCMKHGGVTHRTEDEDGHTGLQVAAAGGFSESLEKLIEQVLKIGPKEDMDDPDEDGRTPLMMAAYNGVGSCQSSKALAAELVVAQANSTACACSCSRARLTSRRGMRRDELLASTRLHNA